MANQRMCGIGDDEENEDMNLYPTFEEQIISLNMLYTEGESVCEPLTTEEEAQGQEPVCSRESTRSYDACWYAIVDNFSEDDYEDFDKEYISYSIATQVKVTKATGVNVYLYGGRDRFDAKIEMVPNNAPVTLGETYTVDYMTGLLLIAYPNEDQVTEFEFSYKFEITGELRPAEEVAAVAVVAPAQEEDDGMIPIIGAVGGLLLIVLIACLIYCYRKKKANQIDTKEETNK